ncbi:hypothetical protein IFM89_006003 [Coptis chinensis]|uniref:Retrotransposon Copia-like N-terminal domain-containing protein n=1 Tax=Coptis chinensis TaxID=261450 RepID=A0A835I0A7_9MAGN|nr:hypothetical protein IFM89_006003 [Coptis chinensis]
MDDMSNTGKNSSAVIGGQSSNSNQPPRYFHDDTGKQITSIKLDGKNYLAWSQAVRVFLRAKMKQKYLTDDPPDENSLSAKTWWSEMSMGDKPLNEHYALLRSLRKELLIYQLIIHDVEIQRKQKEDFQCELFLFSLNPDYAVFKDHILANESFPSAANAYSRLQRAFIAYTPYISKDASAAFVSNGRGGSVREPSYNNPKSASTQDDVLSQILHKLNHFTPGSFSMETLAASVLPNIDDSSTLSSSPTGSHPSTSLLLSNLVSPSVPMSLPDPLPPLDIVSPSNSVSPSDHVSLPDPLSLPDIVSSSEFVLIPPLVLASSGSKPPPVSKLKRAPKPSPAPKSKRAPKPPLAPQSTCVSKPPPASITCSYAITCPSTISCDCAAT